MNTIEELLDALTADGDFDLQEFNGIYDADSVEAFKEGLANLAAMYARKANKIQKILGKGN